MTRASNYWMDKDIHPLPRYNTSVNLEEAEALLYSDPRQSLPADYRHFDTMKECLEHYLVDLHSFIEQHRWLAEISIVTFIAVGETERMESYLNTTMSSLTDCGLDLECLFQLVVRQFYQLSHENTNYNHKNASLPESFLHFINQVDRLSLPRAPTKNVFENVHQKSQSLWTEMPFQLPWMATLSEKKKHEVPVLTQCACLVSKLATQSRKRSLAVVDIGAGQAYLSGHLAYVAGMPRVLALDNNPHQANGAKERISVIVQKLTRASLSRRKNLLQSGIVQEENISLHLPLIPAGLPDSFESNEIHFDSKTQCCIDRSRMKTAERLVHLKYLTEHVKDASFDECIQPCLDQWNADDDSCERDWMMVSLHACGDLSPVMIRGFNESKHCRALISVACCYNVMTEQVSCESDIPLNDYTIKSKDTCSSLPGCPMSSFLEQIMERPFGRTLRMIACQAPQRWTDIRYDTEQALIHNFYRGALHDLMVRHGLWDPAIDPPIVGRMSSTAFCDFVTYVQEALPRLGHAADFWSKEYLEEQQVIYRREFWYPMAVYWTLRTLLSPVMESLILADRALYLLEQPNMKSVQLLPLFDPVKSPRNMAIIAIKE